MSRHSGGCVGHLESTGVYDTPLGSSNAGAGIVVADYQDRGSACATVNDCNERPTHDSAPPGVFRTARIFAPPEGAPILSASKLLLLRAVTPAEGASFLLRAADAGFQPALRALQRCHLHAFERVQGHLTFPHNPPVHTSETQGG